MKQDMLEELYRSCAGQVYLYALSLCKDPHQAEELTSDTFYKALLCLEEEREGVKYWLLKVCRNLFLDRARRQRRRKELPLEEEWLTGQGQDNPLEEYLQNEERQALYRALLRLPPFDRELLTMFYFAGCGTAQIASLTGKTPGAVKTGLSRARIRLKKGLEEEWK